MAQLSNSLLSFTYFKARRLEGWLGVGWALPGLFPSGLELGLGQAGWVWQRIFTWAVPGWAEGSRVRCNSSKARRAVARRPSGSVRLAPSGPARRAAPPPRRPQAIVNTLLAKVHIKKKAGFKPTDKTQAPGGGAAGGFPVQAAFMARLTSLTRRFNQERLPQLYDAPVVVQPTGATIDFSACTFTFFNFGRGGGGGGGGRGRARAPRRPRRFQLTAARRRALRLGLALVVLPRLGVPAFRRRDRQLPQPRRASPPV
jgi:hypothetical protein